MAKNVYISASLINKQQQWPSTHKEKLRARVQITFTYKQRHGFSSLRAGSGLVQIKPKDVYVPLSCCHRDGISAERREEWHLARLFAWPCRCAWRMNHYYKQRTTNGKARKKTNTEAWNIQENGHKIRAGIPHVWKETCTLIHYMLLWTRVFDSFFYLPLKSL